MHAFWENEERSIIRCKGEGRWTWEEYHAVLNDIVAMMGTVTHRVDLIVVEGAGSVMPPGSPRPHFQHATKMYPPNAGASVIVVKSALATAMATLWSKIPGSMMGNVKLVRSLDEAYTFIARDRAKNQNAP
jgi:hypothetical protein